MRYTARKEGEAALTARIQAEKLGVNLLVKTPIMVDIVKYSAKKVADVFTQLDYMEKRGSGFQKITELTSELRLFTEDRMPTFESDASSFFTTVHSVLYGRSDEDFQRVIDQESTPKKLGHPKCPGDQKKWKGTINKDRKQIIES